MAGFWVILKWLCEMSNGLWWKLGYVVYEILKVKLWFVK
jgi:hypothetical protein